MSSEEVRGAQRSSEELRGVQGGRERGLEKGACGRSKLTLHAHIFTVRLAQVVFAHYATLELEKESLCDWPRVRATHRTLSKHEFLMCLMNFELTPYLLSRVDAAATVDQLGRELGATHFTFPQFVELLLRCAVNVGDTLEYKIGSPATTVGLGAVREARRRCGLRTEQGCRYP